MLPWENRKAATHIVSRLREDGTMAYGGEVKNEEVFGDDKNEELLALAQDFLAAIESKSAKHVAECLELLWEKIQDKDREEDKEAFEPKT